MSYSILFGIDTQYERNEIVEKVKPVLESFCRDINVDFHFVDLRWGIRDDTTNDHGTQKICMDEIRKCFASSPLSLPVFIHLGFDRYGWVPIPAQIKSEIFEKVKQSSTNEEVELLEKCFVKDSNNVEPIQKLRSLNEIKNWNESEPKLRNILFGNEQMADLG